MATIPKVSLRKRPIAGAKESLYLDFYPPIRDPFSMRMTRREALGIYIYARPKTDNEREFNKDMLMKAEIIRGLRAQSLLNEEFDFLDKSKKQADFLAYFKAIAQKKDQKWMKVYLHFSLFVKEKCTFGDVTVELCNKFRHYLLNANQLKHTEMKISQNSASGYFSTFRALLKIAHKERMLRENLNDYLDGIDTTDVKKEYLTLDELKKLSNTPCDIPVLKSASLFSCMTGLRISDVLNLHWKDIMEATEGGYCMRIRTEKTETETTLPISDEALELCGERNEGKVFAGLRRHMIYHPLKNWLEKAGITKHITFHCFRHSYATLQIALGTDIYTLSKMLTHKNVSTTQIYADIVNEKKRASANKISLK